MAIVEPKWLPLVALFHLSTLALTDSVGVSPEAERSVGPRRSTMEEEASAAMVVVLRRGETGVG